MMMAGIKVAHGRRVMAVFVVILAGACAWAWARSAANVPLAPAAILKLDTSRPGNEFAPGAVGLSTEAGELSSGRLSAGHPSLVRLMRLLGPSVLRVGGNSVDRSWWTSSDEPPPSWATNTVTPYDLSVLSELLADTGWRVLLGVDFGHFEPARAADEARYAKEILGKDLLGVEIGNEPNDYGHKPINLRPSTYSAAEYISEAEAYRQVLQTAAPGVAVYGPALAQFPWLKEMGTSASMFAELTQHYYPTKQCPRILPSTRAPTPTVSELLSPATRQQEDEALNMLAQAGVTAGRPTRIGETGSGACRGASYASPAFAGALWSLDWALRAASSGVHGINFHGQFRLCGAYTQSPICAPSPEAANAGDVTPRPEYYGILAASRLEGGRFVSTSLIGPDPLPNITTWATIAPGGTLRIAIDNLATVGLAQPVIIPTSGYAATEEPLSGPSAEARGGIALGSAQVTEEGQWRPKLASLLHVRHSTQVIVPPASAVIVTLLQERPDS